jgi:hypothetical protein
MRSTRLFLTSLAALGALMLARAVMAAATNPDGNPYAETIVGRNVFSLKTPPPPPNPEDLVKKDPPPKILLQGLTTILGRRQVLFKVQMPAKAGQPAKEESYVAAEKERYGEIEVLEIDENAGVVKFNNHGTVEPLNMKDHVAKAPVGAPPPPPTALPQPGRPTLPGVPPPTASLNPAQPGSGALTTIGGSREIPTRALRTSSATIGGVPGANPGQEQVVPQLDPEATAVLYEANRLKNEEMTKAGLRPKLPEHPFFSGAIERLKNANPSPQ